jgi:chemotaxis protein CheX
MADTALANKLFVGEELSPDLIEDIKQATISTFATICSETPLFIGTKENGTEDRVVVGIMSLVSKGFALTLHLGFIEKSAELIAKKFAHADIAFESQDMNDVIGELSNIFTGDVSGRLEVWGIRSDLSIPTVARAKELELLLPAKSPAVNLLFKLSLGTFWVKIGIGRPEPVK